MNTVRRAGRDLGVAAVVVGTGLGLRHLATGDLAAPPLHSIDALGRWADGLDPTTVALALLRGGAEATVWYLAVVWTLHALAALTGAARVARVADALSVPAVRRFARGGLGLGLAAAALVQEAPPPGGGATMTPVETPDRMPDPPADAAMVEPRRVDPRGPEPATTGTAVMTPTAATSWEVAPGESFWTIAEDVLADAWGRRPSVAEVDPYWRSLVETNRHRLVDPADPDLIVPGQRFDVPPPPGR